MHSFLVSVYPSPQDAWLEAEAMHATTQLDAVLYNDQAWDKGATLIAEDRPAWRCELWPTVAAEKVGAAIGRLMVHTTSVMQATCAD